MVAHTDKPYLYTRIGQSLTLRFGIDGNSYDSKHYIEITLQQLQEHKGINMNHKHTTTIEELKSLPINDLKEFLKNGKRAFVVETYEEGQEIHKLTKVELPYLFKRKSNFEEQLKSYKSDHLVFTSGRWETKEHYSMKYQYHIQLTLKDVQYLLDNNESTSEDVVWKNPKPSKKNTQPIHTGAYYLEDGYSIPQIAFIDRPQTEAMYPLHKLIPEQKPKVGDITEIDSQWAVVTNREDLNQLKVLMEGPNTTVNLWRITDENNKAIKVMNLNRYSCGTVIDADTNEVLPTIPPGVKIDTDYSYDFTWEHKQISAHFNVDMDSLHTQDELLHKQLSIILDHELNVAKKEWAYIFGPSGSGKSTLAMDYAKSTSKPYILQQGTAQLTVDDLLGYKSITDGTYFPSLLRDAVENGKVFILDEADACNANSLLCLNALKHDTFQFPDALVNIHPDFRLIMTANTYNDYSDEYNSRNPLDKATLDRCAIIEYNMKDYHLALRYGIKYVAQISDLDTKSPRQIEREITNIKIKEAT